MTKLKAIFAGSVLMVGSVAANAASSVDATMFDDVKADVNIVGVAVIGVLIAIAGWRYLRKVIG